MLSPRAPLRLRRLVGASALALGLGGACVALVGGQALPAGASTIPNYAVTIPTLPTVTFSSVGQVIPLAFVITNTGGATGTGFSVALIDPVSSVTTPATCGSTSLAVGADTTCSVSYTVSEADLLGVDPIRLEVSVGGGTFALSGGVTIGIPVVTTVFTIPVVEASSTPTTTTTAAPTTSTTTASTPGRVAATVTTTTDPSASAVSPTTSLTSTDAPLAYTGFDVLPLLVMGGVLVLSGASLIVLAEARRRHLGQLDRKGAAKRRLESLMPCRLRSESVIRAGHR